MHGRVCVCACAWWRVGCWRWQSKGCLQEKSSDPGTRGDDHGEHKITLLVTPHFLTWQIVKQVKPRFGRTDGTGVTPPHLVVLGLVQGQEVRADTKTATDSAPPEVMSPKEQRQRKMQSVQRRSYRVAHHSEDLSERIPAD